ncbi:MAG: response regulator [Deltaproteobacteria bacterium]|nr:response regulator [Deltaproteobacteria bacterium]
MDDFRRRSVTGEHRAAIDELIRLEERNVAGQLGEGDRARWLALTERLFGSRADDRRRFFRIQTHRHAELLLPEGPLRVRATSISAGGVFLETATPDPTLVGKTVELVLLLPMAKERQLLFRVLVRWVSPATAATPGLGVEFVEPTSEQLHLLLEHLRAHLLWLLELSQEKYHFFFQHSADLAILLDGQGQIRDLNLAGSELLGLSAPQLLGSPLERLVVPSSHASVRQALVVAIDQEQRLPGLQLLTAEGQAIPVDAALIPFNVQDLQLGVILVAQDLRHRRAFEDKQRAVERRLFESHKLATIGQITAGIAHDINNPLAYILSNLTQLDDYLEPLLKLTAQAKALGPASPVEPALLEEMEQVLPELISDCLEGSRRIRDILREIKDFTRVDTEAIVRVELNDALDAAIRMVNNLIKHRARLERAYAPGLPATHCNFGRLSQVFLNLLTNAAQAFDTVDLENNRIRVSTALVDGKLQLQVADNGRGIPPEMVKLIFQPFFTTRRREGGTGLGLSIAKESAQSLGGDLSVTSTVGVGTCFTLTLPVREDQVRVVPAAIRDAAPPRRRKLLMIDDEEAVLRGFRRVLSGEFEIQSTSSPRAALELVAEHPFDVILCDVMMPELSGLEFHRRLQANLPEQAARIVFITGGTFTPEEEQQLRAMANPVLAKPIEPAELAQILHQVGSAA